MGVAGGEGVEAEVDGGGSTPMVVSTLCFLKEHFKLDLNSIFNTLHGKSAFLSMENNKETVSWKIEFGLSQC